MALQTHKCFGEPVFVIPAVSLWEMELYEMQIFKVSLKIWCLWFSLSKQKSLLRSQSASFPPPSTSSLGYFKEGTSYCWAPHLFTLPVSSWCLSELFLCFLFFCEALLAPECSLAAICWLWGQCCLSETARQQNFLETSCEQQWLGLKWPKNSVKSLTWNCHSRQWILKPQAHQFYCE